MKLSIEWLRELVDLPQDLESICQDLTLLGLEVEQVEEVGLELSRDRGRARPAARSPSQCRPAERLRGQ